MITPSQFDEMKRRTDRARGVLPSPEQATTSFGDKPGTLSQQKPLKRIRQSSKPLLNGLETEFYHILKRDWGDEFVFPQAIRLKLGNGIWYKPDFMAVQKLQHDAICGLHIVFFEVKGPHSFRGGFENLKVAASKYPMFKFWLVWKDGDWRRQEVLA